MKTFDEIIATKMEKIERRIELNKEDTRDKFSV